MTKRNREQTHKLAYVPEKKVEWQQRLPKSLWHYMGRFLQEDDYLYTFLNHYFALITLNWIAHSYKNRFQFFPFQYEGVHIYTPKLLVNLNLVRRLYKSHYYTLYHPALIELFMLVEQKDSKNAQALLLPSAI